MNPDELNYMNLGSLWGTQITPSFNNQQIPLSDGISSIATRDASNYMSLNPNAGMGGVGSGSSSGNWWDSFTNSGTKNMDGSTNPNYAGGLMNAIQGFGNMLVAGNALKQQDKAFNFSKEMSLANLNAKQVLTNKHLQDQHNARLANNSNYSGKLVQV